MDSIPQNRIIGSQAALEEDVDESFFDLLEKCSNGPVTEEDFAACPLFAGSLDQLPQDHANTLALKSILHDEITPQEKAETFKERGNKALSRGPVFYEDAFDYYSQAIDQKSGVSSENAVYYSNRAQVNILMKNYGRAIYDCVQSLKLNPSYIKSYFRAAKASFELKKWKQVCQFCEAGLRFEPDNGALKALFDSTCKKIAEEDAREAAKLQEEERKREEKENFSKQLQSRGIIIGQPLFEDTHKYEKSAQVYIDSDNKIHWPILFLYPEHNQSDFVHDILEEDTVYAHLHNMFGSEQDGGPGNPPWDIAKKYHPDSLVVYYKSYMTLPRDSALRALHEEKHTTQQKWVKVNVNHTFKKILSRKDYVVPSGIPIFFVVVENSSFEKSMLEQK